jgi:hypothetical protein
MSKLCDHFFLVLQVWGVTRTVYQCAASISFGLATSPLAFGKSTSFQFPIALPLRSKAWLAKLEGFLRCVFI